MIEQLAVPKSKDILLPTKTPEIAFQSYEVIKGNGDYRDVQMTDFMTDKIQYPVFDYPLLSATELRRKITTLDNILVYSNSLPEDQREAVWDTVSYRIAEMYWLIGMQELNDAYQKGDDATVARLIPELKEAGEQLYGSTTDELISQVKGELHAQISEINLDEQQEKYVHELLNGFIVEIDGKEVPVPAINLDSQDRLPVSTTESLLRLKEKLQIEYSDIIEIVEDYYQEYIVTRPEGARYFTPDDMYKLFTKVHEGRDPDNASGIRILLDDDARSMSWSTPDMAIIVGARRRTNIDSVIEMQAKIIHEYGIHAGRAVSGLKTELPILGTGVFTDADYDELSDYLTFEEGFALLGESVIQDTVGQWDIERFAKSYAIILADQGYDFRQVYEVLWRINAVISRRKLDIQAHKFQAYLDCERVFRGTPTNMPRIDKDGNVQAITFNKDLSYVYGRIKAAKFVENASDELLDVSFKVKIDPTNKRQLQLAQEYIAK
jgi:hypothetical protein